MSKKNQKNLRKVGKKIIDVSKIKHTEINQLNIKWDNRYVIQQKFKRGNYTKEEIIAKAQEMSDEGKKRGRHGWILTSIQYPDKWRSGYKTYYGEPVSVYEHSDSDDTTSEPKTFKSFRIYYVHAPRRGGNDKNNDCLYKCLKQVLYDKLPWKTASTFKKFLGIKRNDKIDIKDIGKIDERLRGYKINVTGDYIYTSPKANGKEINIKLVGGHYSLNTDGCLRIFGIAYEEKKPMLYYRYENKVYCYDAERGDQVLSTEEFKTNYRMTKESIYIPVPVDKPTEEGKQLKHMVPSLKVQYDEWIKAADELKEETDGLINLYKTGSEAKTALNLFDRFNKTVRPDPILQDEAKWNQEATSGSLIWYDTYEGEAYKYDIVSRYPSTMQHKLMFFPVKRGTFVKIDEQEKYGYGIYRCIIEPNEKTNKYFKKLFRFNKHNKYTHIDVERAKELNLTVKLIQDDQPNALMYKKTDLLTGSQLFGDFVKLLFPLKQKKIKKAKIILNILWGALCQINQIPLYLNESSNDELLIESDRDILAINPIDENNIKLDIVRYSNYYETNFARIAPYLLARGRALLSRHMEPNIEHIRRVHTDGYISAVKLDVKTGSDIGELKFEGYSTHCKITNNISIDGEFEI